MDPPLIDKADVNVESLQKGEKLDMKMGEAAEIRMRQPRELELPKYRGLVGTGKTIVAEEGVAALWNGVIPGI